MLSMSTLALFIVVLPVAVLYGADVLLTLNVTMPGLRPPKEDYYACTGIKVHDVDRYIVEYEALANAATAHHIILYSCVEPASTRPYWTGGKACADDEQILFAWAKNAPPTQLPNDVGFHIGGDSKAKYLVISVHYARVLADEEQDDHSGLMLTISTTPPKYRQGILLFSSGNGKVPPGKGATKIDVSCQYQGSKDLHAFAFRTHAHGLGRIISAYKKNGLAEGGWELLGKGNPQWPQAFYPMNSHHVIQKGDIMVARCVYNSTTSNHLVTIGGAHTAEMCNFYMMFYVEGEAKFEECVNDMLPAESRQLPADSLVPLPPNATLDAIAHSVLITDATDVEQLSGSQLVPIVVAVLLVIPVVSALCFVTLHSICHRNRNANFRKYTEVDKSDVACAPLYVPIDEYTDTDSDL